MPIIAGAHHERLNGTGYPNRLRAEEIPVQSKMMSIADIYDALTASDRPYKKAVPARAGARHPRLQREGRAPRRGARAHLQGREDLGARRRAMTSRTLVSVLAR